MCIAFLFIGDEDFPTLICNNRDEYFVRPTLRGSISSENDSISYAPKDLEGGGTWIAVDQKMKQDQLKFAIVLNYDVYRDKYDYGSYDERSLKSRGKLVQHFINPTNTATIVEETEEVRNNMSAKEYAEYIFQNRYSYRPFNLIVSDSVSGTYYVSWSKAQLEVHSLLPGQLYGITNGYMYGEWEKVEQGKMALERIIRSGRYDAKALVACLQEGYEVNDSMTSHSYHNANNSNSNNDSESGIIVSTDNVYTI